MTGARGRSRQRRRCCWKRSRTAVPNAGTFCLFVGLTALNGTELKLKYWQRKTISLKKIKSNLLWRAAHMASKNNTAREETGRSRKTGGRRGRPEQYIYSYSSSFHKIVPPRWALVTEIELFRKVLGIYCILYSVLCVCVCVSVFLWGYEWIIPEWPHPTWAVNLAGSIWPVSVCPSALITGLFVLKCHSSQRNRRNPADASLPFFFNRFSSPSQHSRR